MMKENRKNLNLLANLLVLLLVVPQGGWEIGD